jgi:hypothetical protein
MIDVYVNRLRCSFSGSFLIFFLSGIVGGGVQLGPLGTAATNGHPRVIMMVEKLVELLAGETEVLRENLHPVPLCPPQNPYAARTRTRSASVGSLRLTAWATARTFPAQYLTELHMKLLNLN